jgi:hypothetical protein
MHCEHRIRLIPITEGCPTSLALERLAKRSWFDGVGAHVTATTAQTRLQLRMRVRQLSHLVNRCHGSAITAY